MLDGQGKWHNLGWSPWKHQYLLLNRPFKQSWKKHTLRSCMSLLEKPELSTEEVLVTTDCQQSFWKFWSWYESPIQKDLRMPSVSLSLDLIWFCFSQEHIKEENYHSYHCVLFTLLSIQLSFKSILVSMLLIS